jgi:radical SAM superfamily enzyme YgiQ (UPF0313 family)
MMEFKSLLLISANVYKDPYPVYPIGISYIKTFLKKSLPDYSICTYDMNFGNLDDLSALLKKENFNYVGLSLRNIDDNNIFEQNSFVSWYKEIVTCIRNSCKSILIVGGAGYSIFPDILYNELQPDFGIKGEGELSLTELLKSLDEKKDYRRIDGLVYKDVNDKIIVNKRNNYEYNLSLKLENEWIPYYWENGGMLNIQTKRGCPHHCIYCSYPVIEGHKVRKLNVDNVIASLKELYFEKHITYIFFTDSVFNMEHEYNDELCHKIIENDIKISWGAYFSPRNLSKEDLILYKKSGLTHIEFGTESFSDQQLVNYQKGFTWNDILEKSHFCDDLGIFYAHFMILAGYGETEESLNETFEHSRLLTNTVIFPFIGMRIYPFTRLYDYAINEGIINSPQDLLSPHYYLSKQVNVDTIKIRAAETGVKWIFPGDEASDEMEARFRKKKRRGPLWEFLKY